MMEWLLNIQQAVKSMQGVVGRLHYGGASVLHLFISPLFSILVPRLLSCVSSVPLVFFFCHSFSAFLHFTHRLFLRLLTSTFLPSLCNSHFSCLHNVFPFRSLFFMFFCGNF